MIKFMTTLTLLLMFLLSTTTGVQAQEEVPEVPNENPTEETRKPVRGSVQGVKCLAPGNIESVTYDHIDINGPEASSELIKVVDNIMVGSTWPESASGQKYACMGRCGFNCWGSPGRLSRMYTKDCLTLDVCSQQQNACGGGSDKNCGDEFREAVGDTALALFNICKYNRGGHVRAARGAFVQGEIIIRP